MWICCMRWRERIERFNDVHVHAYAYVHVTNGVNIIALALANAACESPLAPRDGVPVYAASLQQATTGPDHFVVVATATNPNSYPIRFTLRTPCTIVVRVYDTFDRSSAPVWNQEGFPGGCKSFPLEVRLGPRRLKDWSMPISAEQVLAGMHYHLDASADLGLN